jgi:hypothetical protein
MNTILTAPPADMPDVEFLFGIQEIVRHQRAAATPELIKLAAEVDRRLVAAVRLRDGLVFRYAGPTLHDFVVGNGDAPLAVKIRADGAHALAIALLNPGRRLGLQSARSRRAWHASVCQALDTIERIEPRIAAAMAFADTHDGPGTRLYERKGQVLISWRPAPGGPRLTAGMP